MRKTCSGRPFVGPAGKLFNRALEELGLERRDFYITNAVKHFRFEQRGKRRLHRNPERSHVQACRPWLEAEIAKVRPRVVVCMGAIAAQAVLGAGFRLMEQRGLVADAGRWHGCVGHGASIMGPASKRRTSRRGVCRFCGRSPVTQGMAHGVALAD